MQQNLEALRGRTVAERRRHPRSSRSATAPSPSAAARCCAASTWPSRRASSSRCSARTARASRPWSRAHRPAPSDRRAPSLLSARRSPPFDDWHRIGFVPQRVTRRRRAFPPPCARWSSSGRLSRRRLLRPLRRADRVASRGARGRRPRRPGRRRRRHAVRRPAAARAHRPGAGRRAGPALPRRADRRRRPAQPAGVRRRPAHRSQSAARPSCWSPTSWARCAAGRPGGGDARRPDRVRRHRRSATNVHGHHHPVDAATTTSRTRLPARPMSPIRGRVADEPAELVDLLSDFMQRALLAAVFTGLAAPAVGTYLVQRRLALMGDGIGHVAVTGVALGLLTGTSPTWTAVVVAILGAVAHRADPRAGPHQRRRRAGAAVLRRHRRRRLLTGLAGQSAATLQQYLFGSITTISVRRRLGHRALAAVVVVVARRAARRSCSRSPRTRSSPGSPGSTCASTTCWSRCSPRSRHRRDAHRRAAAGLRADGGAGRDRRSSSPGRSAPRCWPRWSRRARLARRGGRLGARCPRPKRRAGPDDRAARAGRLRG